MRLPLGISFYTFQTMSYTIDVYRGHVRPQRNLATFATFVCLFPQLIAGPIVRYSDIEAELHTRRFCLEDIGAGARRFTVGLGKKVLLANVLGELVSSAGNATVLGAWLGAVGYLLQIYFDFSGYSDMAIGLGRMFGFTFPENFDYPYLARSVTDFWRRWHQTLGQWFRDYVYIPLGGSRTTRAKWIRNVAVVWLLTGLWHGAAWNFVLWGFVFFVLIALEKFCIGGFLERHRFLSRLYFLFLIPQTWVVFRISDLGELGDYFSRLYPFLSSGESVFAGDLLRQLKSYWWLFALGILLATPWPRRFYEKYRATPLVGLPLFAVFWLCLYLIATGTGNPFLYARF